MIEDKCATRLTLEIDYPDGTCSYSIGIPNWDPSMDQMVDELIRPLLLAAGWHPNNVDDVFGER